MSQSVSVGVVSATDRQGLGLTELESYIQTDAYIGPGSSGGPLLDLDGKVVGICIGLSAVRDQVGPGFAIPSNMASAILPELEKPGQVPRGWLGVAVRADREPGAIVSKALIPGIQELKEGDRILALDGKPVKDPTQLKRRVLSKRPGEEIQLSVMRDGRSLNVSTTLRDAQGVSSIPKSKARTQDFFGAQLSMDPASGEMKVAHVSQGSQAEVAGLMEKDTILEINGCMIGDWAEIREAIGVDAKGPIRILLQRGQVTLDVQIAR
jgi:S1-C subfamily serine protease